MNGNVCLVIKVISGPDAGKSFLVKDTCFVGTQEMCVVRLSDPEVEPLLARLTLRGESFTITDVSDKAGLKVNNRIAKSMKLFQDDTISAGGTVIRVEAYDVSSGAGELHAGRIDESEKPEVVAEEKHVAPDFVTRQVKKDDGKTVTSGVTQDREDTRVIPQSISGKAAVDALLRDAQRSGEKNVKTKYLGVIVVLGIAGIVVALCLASLISSKRLVEKNFNEATRFAKENPGETRRIIEKYTQVKNEAGWVSPKIRDYLSSEIVRLLGDVAANEEELKVLLTHLDQSASELTARQKYNEALAVYRKVDGKYRTRVLELRKSAIENLVRQAAGHDEKVREVRLEEQHQVQAANEKQMKEKMEATLAEVTRFLVNGESKESIRLLEGVLADGAYSSVKPGVEEALTTAKLLNAIDRMNSLKSGNTGSGESPASTSAVKAAVLGNLSPVINAILAIRSGDMWEARVQLEKSKEHFLYPGLLALTKMSDKDWVQEKDAVRSFSVIWSAVMGKSVTTIPVVDDCINQWNDAARVRGQEIKDKLSAEIRAFQKKYDSTGFARKYERLFNEVSASKAAPNIPVKPTVAVVTGSGFGDAKIIQVDGPVFFVEADEGIPDGPGNSIGLFTEKTLFKLSGTNKVAAVRMEIHAAVPFRVLGKKQASFSLPNSFKAAPPAVGDRVLIRKDIQVGTRIVSTLQKTVIQKLFEDLFESQKLNAAWSHAQGAVRQDRNRLCVDRNEGLPVEWKKGEQKVDLRLLHEFGVDPLKVEFDYFRKAEGGLCIGVGDLEFLTGTVDGRKSGIYVKGVLVKPASFTRPSSIDPQRILIIKGQTVAYMAAGKSSAECRISVSAGESSVKNIQFSSEGKLWMDNFIVSRLYGSGGAEISAVSTDGKEMLISRGHELDWDNVQKSQQVYVFGLLDHSGQKPSAIGRVDGFVTGDRLLCSVLDGHVSGSKETIWLTPDITVAQEEGATVGGDLIKAKEVQYPSAVYGVIEQSKPGTFTVVPDAVESGIAGEGFFGLVDRLVIHSETGEKLAAWVGREIRCEFPKADSRAGKIVCKPPEGFQVSSMIKKGVLLSRKLLAGSDRVDLAGKMIPGSISNLKAKQSFWISKNGNWKEKPDGITSSWETKSKVPPILLCSETFKGNVQYDLSLRVEDAGPVPKHDWMKDVMIQLDFSDGKKGVTFAIGAGTVGGMAVYSDVITVKQEENNPERDNEHVSFGRFGEFGTNTEVKIEKYTEPGLPSLTLGRNYEFRVRRVGAVVSFYVNGKRLGYVHCPEFQGNVRLMLAAPGRNLTVGRVSAREVSLSCVTPVKEPVLGEFGYVQWSDSAGILIDASMNGAALNDTVSVVEVDKVVEGEKSKTVFIKRVALGTIKEIGSMTVLIGRTDGREPVKKGMKVLRGTQPVSFLFTDTRIGSIDEGL